MNSDRSKTSRRAARALIVVAAIALIAGCGSSSKAKSEDAGTTSSSAAGTTGDASTTTLPSGPTTTTGSSSSSGKGFSAPCGLVTVGDVQAVLPNAPAGEARLATSTIALCAYQIDTENKVTISLATGPAIEATKAGVASLPNQTKVDGLGDVGYSSDKGTRLDVHFFKGNTEILISAYGTTGGLDPLIALSKKVDAAL